MVLYVLYDKLDKPIAAVAEMAAEMADFLNKIRKNYVHKAMFGLVA